MQKSKHYFNYPYLLYKRKLEKSYSVILTYNCNYILKVLFMKL